jgi:hypothetical protein
VGLEAFQVRSRFQSNHLNTAVLSEMVIEGEGPSDATSVKHGERDRITKGPALVDVSSEDLPGSLLLRRKHSHDRQTADEQAIDGQSPAPASVTEGWPSIVRITCLWPNGPAACSATSDSRARTPLPRVDCCVPAPPVFEFDPAGKLVNSWEGPGQGYDWPQIDQIAQARRG